MRRTTSDQSAREIAILEHCMGTREISPRHFLPPIIIEEIQEHKQANKFRQHHLPGRPFWAALHWNLDAFWARHHQKSSQVFREHRHKASKIKSNGESKESESEQGGQCWHFFYSFFWTCGSLNNASDRKAWKGMFDSFWGFWERKALRLLCMEAWNATQDMVRLPHCDSATSRC